MFNKFLNPLWQIFYVFGQPFNVVHGQILKNNGAMWSHFFAPGTILLKFHRGTSHNKTHFLNGHSTTSFSFFSLLQINNTRSWVIVIVSSNYVTFRRHRCSSILPILYFALEMIAVIVAQLLSWSLLFG